MLPCVSCAGRLRFTGARRSGAQVGCGFGCWACQAACFLCAQACTLLYDLPALPSSLQSFEEETFEIETDMVLAATGKQASSFVSCEPWPAAALWAVGSLQSTCMCCGRHLKLGSVLHCSAAQLCHTSRAPLTLTAACCIPAGCGPNVHSLALEQLGMPLVRKAGRLLANCLGRSTCRTPPQCAQPGPRGAGCEDDQGRCH